MPLIRRRRPNTAIWRFSRCARLGGLMMTCLATRPLLRGTAFVHAFASLPLPMQSAILRVDFHQGHCMPAVCG